MHLQAVHWRLEAVQMLVAHTRTRWPSEPMHLPMKVARWPLVYVPLLRPMVRWQLGDLPLHLVQLPLHSAGQPVRSI